MRHISRHLNINLLRCSKDMYHFSLDPEATSLVFEDVCDDSGVNPSLFNSFGSR